MSDHGLRPCGHDDDGWCLECVKGLREECEALRRQLQAIADMAREDWEGEDYDD